MIIDRESVKLNEDELRQRLQGPIDDHAREAVKRIRSVMEPAYLIKKTAIDRSAGGLDLGFGDMESRNLERNLEGCSTAYIVAATLGNGVDMAVKKAAAGDMSAEFFLDAAGSAMIESVIDHIHDSLEEKTKPRFAPGYGDLSIKKQAPLLRFMDADKIGIKLTEDDLMIPQKSITCIMGVKDEDN